MLALETRINGIPIGFAYVVRKTSLDNNDYIYAVEYHRIGRKPSVINFKIVHNRDEEAEKLSLLIYEELYKRLKKVRVSKK